MTRANSTLVLALAGAVACRGEQAERLIPPHAAPAAPVSAAPAGPVDAASESTRAAGLTANADTAAEEPPLTLGIPAGYADVRDTLRKASPVPVLVPRLLFGDPNDDSVYVALQDVDSVGYSLIFSPVNWCTGESVCRFGSVDGQRRPTPLHTPEGRRVRLADGRTAYFTPGFCSAGCSDATLAWTDGPYVYYVGIKRGRLDQLLPMAESMMPLP